MTIFLILALLLSGCATSAVDARPEPAPATNENLIDPQTGYAAAAEDPKTATRYARAVRSLNEGRAAEAEKQLEELLARDPSYGPALLLLARFAIERGDLARARDLVERAAGSGGDYLAAEIYRAEIALAEGNRAAALAAYSRIAADPAATEEMKARHADLRRQSFDALFARAMSEPAAASIVSLREALGLVESEAARILLARRLLETGAHEESMRELEPLLARGAAENDEVQEILAEIDVRRGRYEEAIFRLDRLARRSSDPRFDTRLAEVKRLWSEANMPPQYHRALETAAITRADFAVLLFWKVSPVRFARVGQPPIAVDIEDVPGREELVRAMALGLFPVDPVTRSVGPYRVVTANSFSRLVARLFTLRGALPACASGVQEPNDVLRGQKMLAACGVDVAPLATGDAPVSGRYASRVLEKLDALVAGVK